MWRDCGADLEIFLGDTYTAFAAFASTCQAAVEAPIDACNLEALATQVSSHLCFVSALDTAPYSNCLNTIVDVHQRNRGIIQISSGLQ
jgi:hypothetical protein